MARGHRSPARDQAMHPPGISRVGKRSARCCRRKGGIRACVYVYTRMCILRSGHGRLSTTASSSIVACACCQAEGPFSCILPPFPPPMVARMGRGGRPHPQTPNSLATVGKPGLAKPSTQPAARPASGLTGMWVSAQQCCVCSEAQASRRPLVARLYGCSSRRAMIG
jgi:hypothetical protein